MKNISNKAQMAVEYMIIMGLVILVTIPLFYYAMSESNINVQLNNANDAVNTLARAADTVYSIGTGSKKYVWVNMPGGIQTYSLTNKTVLIKLYVFGGLSDIFRQTKAELAGVIPISKGQHRIVAEMLESGYVQFGEANDSQPPIVTWTDPSGTINYNGIVLRATTNEYALCKYDENDLDYSSMSDNFVGSALTHEKDIGILTNGNYSYFVRCQDPNGNVMQQSAIINFTIVPLGEGENETPEINETYEPYPPIIILISPENNYTDNDGIVLFQYNVTDDSSILFCQLIINNTVYQSEWDVTKNITQDFTQWGLNYGNYIWNINCSDIHGNKNSSLIRNITINYTQDYDLPVVNLIGPLDNSTRNYWLVGFSYNTTDASSGIDYCNLHMNGVLDQGGSLGWVIQDYPIIENQLETITIPLFKGNYAWNISCIDNSSNANKGYSETWNLRVNITAGEEAFLDSCAGVCGYNGYMDGLCRQNAQKCNEYIGGVWESRGDQYCPVETGDFCCCAQETLG